MRKDDTLWLREGVTIRWSSEVTGEERKGGKGRSLWVRDLRWIPDNKQPGRPCLGRGTSAGGIWQCGRYFRLTQLRNRCCWHLWVGRSQGWCQPPCNAQDGPLRQSIFCPQVSVVLRLRPAAGSPNHAPWSTFPQLVYVCKLQHNKAISIPYRLRSYRVLLRVHHLKNSCFAKCYMKLRFSQG